MIIPRVNNSGATGNNGMQEIKTSEIVMRELMEEKFNVETDKVHLSCQNGHEFYLIGEDMSIQEEIELSQKLQKDRLCPFCDKTFDKDFSFSVQNEGNLTEIDFEIDGRVYPTIYKPSCYRFVISK